MSNPILLVSPEFIEYKDKPGPVVVRRKREGIQLCKVYNPEKPPKWKQVIFERKLDCYRCIARVKDGKAETLTSTGLPHWNTNHIIKQLELAAAKYPKECDNIVLDGEVVHDTLPFDVAGGILRQHDPHPEAYGLRLHAWDILPVEEFDSKTCSKVLLERKRILDKTIKLINVIGGKLVGEAGYIQGIDYKTGPITDIDKYAEEFVEDGDEGIVAKDAYGLYEYKKSGVWLKWKPNFDTGSAITMKEGDFRIVGIQMGRGKHTGRVGALLIAGYLLDDGNISTDKPDEYQETKMVSGKAGTGLDDRDRIQFLKWFEENTLIGRAVEVKYQSLSSKGKVRFPVFYRLRPDKD